MKLKLIALYLKETQLEYIVAIRTAILQENFNFNFEDFDNESNFAQLHEVAVYPSFFLVKNDKPMLLCTGKINFSELKEILVKHNYVSNS